MFLRQICSYKHSFPGKNADNADKVEVQKKVEKFEKEVEALKAEIIILENGVQMKETELENEPKRKIDEDQRIQDLQEEVRQLKALNYRYKNDNEELTNQILSQKSKEHEDNFFLNVIYATISLNKMSTL